MMRKLRLLGLSLTALLALGAVLSASAWATNPPVNGLPPFVSGTAEIGGTLTTTKGSWTESPTSYAYQWQRCNASGAECVNISGATQTTYTVAEADAGHTLRSKVTAFNSAGEGTGFSKVTAVITVPKSPEFTTKAKEFLAIPFEFKSENMYLQGSGEHLPCKEVTGTGSISKGGPVNPSTTVQEVHLKFVNCTVNGSEGAWGCKTFETSTLHGHLGYISQEPKRVGLVFEQGTSPFGETTCVGGKTTIQGALIAEITPLNTFATSLTLGTGGLSKLEGYVPQHLEWNFPKGIFSTLEVPGSGKLTTKTEIKVVA